MMWIVVEHDDPLRLQFVDDALHALPVQAHRARQPRYRLCRRRQRNGPEHLPARAGQPETGDKAVAGRVDQGPVDAEYLEDQLSQRVEIPFGVRSGLVFMSIYDHLTVFVNLDGETTMISGLLR